MIVKRLAPLRFGPRFTSTLERLVMGFLGYHNQRADRSPAATAQRAERRHEAPQCVGQRPMKIPIPGASLGEPLGELAGQHAQAVASRRVGTACWPMGVKRLPQLSASARLLNCWAGRAPTQAMSAVPFIPARGKLRATRPNDCNASETASSKAGRGRRHCKVDADKGRTTTDWLLTFEFGF